MPSTARSLLVISPIYTFYIYLYDLKTHFNAFFCPSPALKIFDKIFFNPMHSLEAENAI